MTAPRPYQPPQVRTKEVVLPSGRFASIRPLTWLDRVKTYSVVDLEERLIRLAVRCVTIDGAPLSREQADEMELTEAQPIIEEICKAMIAGSQSKGVA
jgi:hypothetical protein